ncbi:MAG TPA: hypothetical protein VFI25_00740 [Planctomycetota bacterium]|nr:hypothetical protein [Planctomycetota bacterium]
MYTFVDRPLPRPEGGCCIPTETIPFPEQNRWTTDEAGSCHVSLLLPGAWSMENCDFVLVSLYASKPGVGASGFASWSVPENAADLVLLPRCPVIGAVLDSGGLPFPGASVRLQTPDWPHLPDHQDPRIPPEAISGPDGRFRTEIDSSDCFSIQARHGEQETDIWTLSGSDGEPLFLTLRIAGPYAIDGSVADAAGKPVPETEVVAREVRLGTDGPAQPQDELFRATSEPDGRFLLRLPRPGRYLLAAQTETHFLGQTVFVDVDEGSPRTHASLRLLEGAFIAGSVRWSSGEPVGAGWVAADAAEPRESPFSADRSQPWCLFREADAPLEGDGSFRIGPLHPAGAYTVRCGLPSSNQALASRPGILAGTVGLELALPPESGRRAFVSVVVHPPSACGSTGSIHADLLGYEPGPDGEPLNEDTTSFFQEEARLLSGELIPGRHYALRVWSKEGEALVEPWIAALPGRELDVQLRAYGQLEVEVVEPSGRPVPFAEITMTCLRRHPLADDGWDSNRWRADEAGIDRTQRLRPGTYEIRAKKRGALSETTSVQVFPDQEARARLVLPTVTSARSPGACRGRS